MDDEENNELEAHQFIRDSFTEWASSEEQQPTRPNLSGQNSCLWLLLLLTTHLYLTKLEYYNR